MYMSLQMMVSNYAQWPVTMGVIVYIYGIQMTVIRNFRLSINALRVFRVQRFFICLGDVSVIASIQ